MTQLSIAGTDWLIDGQAVNPGSPAEGLLVNVRMVNTVFEDVGPQARVHLPADFDPEANSDHFIAQIPEYAAHGINAFTLSMQGGMPGYEGAVNSAFNADGSLRSAYLDRVGRVIRAAADSGCGVILSCLYQRQHSHARALVRREAIHAAVGYTAAWIAAEGFAHVALEIANEFAHAGYGNWPEGAWLRSPEGQIELMATARRAAPDLLVSTSGMGSGTAAAQIAAAVDFLIIHFNNTATGDIPGCVVAARAHGKAVVCNEDDKLGAVGAEAARLSIVNGAGWGFMHSAKNQNAPFEFDGPEDDPEVYAMLRRLTTPGEVAAPQGEAAAFVLIERPKDGDNFAVGDAIDVRVNIAGEAPGCVVVLCAGETEIGRCASAPWEFTWQAAPLGKHDLVAVVRDAAGAELMRSRPVDIVVG